MASTPISDPDSFVPLGELRSTGEAGTLIDKRVRIIAGRGQWAYYVREENMTNCVIADTIFNRHAPHFAGWLLETHPGGRPRSGWCRVHGWIEPPREQRRYIEDEDEGLPRMEHRDPEKSPETSPEKPSENSEKEG